MSNFKKVTISGKICSGKSVLLQGLQKKLKWQVISTGKFFREYVSKYHLSLESAEEQNEKLTKEVDYMVRDMLHADGNLIVDGWLSGLMSKGANDVLRVLLVCEDNIRYERFSTREKTTFEEAKILVEQRQSSWFKKLSDIYKRDDFLDPKNYDLIIDTSYDAPEAVLQKVLHKIEE